MKLQLSIRGALYLTTAIAVYAAIVALAFRGDFWGKGITFAVTCALGVWFLSAISYWVLITLLNLRGIHEHEPSSVRSQAEFPPATPSPRSQPATLLKEKGNTENQP